MLNGCDTLHKSIKHRNLEVQTRMSNTVFLDPTTENKTLFLQVKNTSDKHDIKIEEDLKQALETKGYKIVSSATKAKYMLQVNILQVDKNNLEDPFGSARGVNSGVQGAVTGGIAGAAMGSSDSSIAAGAVIGGVAGTVADAMVEVVNYSIVADLRISERSIGVFVDEHGKLEAKEGTGGKHVSSWTRKTDWKQYQTRVVSAAKKTNLKFEEALPEIKKGLVNSIAGLF